MKKRKGFTLMELLVVIAIIALLMGILMPALGRVREMANQLVCGTNCRGLTTAMMIYAQDFDEQFPQAGDAGNTNPSPVWGTEPGIVGGSTNIFWYDENATPVDLYPNNAPTVSASLFLLVRYADVGAKSFICPSSGQKKFEPGKAGAPSGTDIVDCWDFGTTPYDFVSFAYGPGYSSGTSTAIIAGLSSASAMPVLADKSPWCDKSIPDSANASNFNLTSMKGMYDWNGVNTSTDFNKAANSGNHNRDGQNVAYSDNHVSFEKRPIVGQEDDEIYTRGDGYNLNSASPILPPFINYLPYSKDDSVLINENDGVFIP